jgi:TonB family protein
MRLTGAGASVALLLSDDISGPVTFGWLKPVVLLPSRFPSLAPEIREAILCHEMMHVNRRDWLFTLAEELVRAVFWFHPAIWWVISEIQLAREQTVDQAVIETTRAREPYLDALLLMAGIATHGSSTQMDLAPAPMFLRRRHLKRRLLEAMREVRMSKISKTRLTCVLSAAAAMVVAACWLAASSFPLSAAPQVVADAPGVSVNLNGAPLMHHSAVSYPHDALAHGIEGTVVVQVKLDAKGEVADAAVLSGPDELGKSTLQSVQRWHFDKSVAATTQVVNVDYSKPAAVAGDKLLFDRATADIGRGDYDAARLTLNTLINTWPSSDFLLRAKVAIADSWFREGGAYGLAQAEAEYKDLVRFYPEEKDAVESRLQELQRLQQLKTANIGGRGRVSSPLPKASERLAHIVVTGLSDSARDELLSRLPVREGAEWTQQMLESVRAAVAEFDPHLLTVLDWSGGELELRIGVGLTPGAFMATNGGTTVTFRSTSGSSTGTALADLARMQRQLAEQQQTSPTQGYQQEMLRREAEELKRQVEALQHSSQGQQVDASSATVPTDVYKIGNGVSPPAVVYKVDPEFPQGAGVDQTGGAVMLSCVIGEDGRPADIHVVKSLGFAFDSNAVDAISHWVFRPGMSNGMPVKVRATVVVNFRR